MAETPEVDKALEVLWVPFVASDDPTDKLCRRAEPKEAMADGGPDG